MRKMVHSLQTKLTVSFVLLILVVSSGTFFYTFGETKKALRDLVRTELTAVASMTAANLSGAVADTMESLKPGDESGEAFVHLRDRLRALRASHPDFKYVYTMRKAGDGVQFIVDADYGNIEDPGGAIGEAYESPTAALFRGFGAPSVEKDFYVDKWGTLLSGFAPLRNSRGEVVGIVGVDMSSNLVLQKERFLGNTIYGIIGLGILVAGFFIFLFSKTIIRDIKKLNRTANAISNGEMSAAMDVERKDEIGELAESFSRMVASLKIMMMTEEEADVPHERAS
jgi:adenylate cyclase